LRRRASGRPSPRPRRHGQRREALPVSGAGVQRRRPVSLVQRDQRAGAPL